MSKSYIKPLFRYEILSRRHFELFFFILKSFPRREEKLPKSWVKMVKCALNEIFIKSA